MAALRWDTPRARVSRAPFIALALIAFVLLSRAPFAAQTLWAHDSVLYANALEVGFHVDDDLLSQRPHPPGYVLYVASAAMARAAGLGTNGALVLVSALASALAAAALFLLARRLMPQAVALLVSVAFAVDPLVWQYSEIAYPYAVLALGSTIVASAFFLARGRSLRGAVAASLLFAIAGGFRQDLLVLLAPLWLWCVAPLGARRAALAALAVAAGCAAWLAPTMALSGGPLEYMRVLTTQATFVRDAYSVPAQGLPAFFTNLLATAYAAGWGLLAAAPLALAALVLARRERPREIAFLLVWCVPPTAVYVVIHIGDWGYVLSALPGVYLLAGIGIASVLARVPRPRLAFAGLSGPLVTVPALVFMVGAAPFSSATIIAHDNELVARVAYVREHYASRSTLILTREDFMLVRYYLPEYRSRQYDPEPFTHSVRRMRASRMERIVVFTAGLVPERPLDVRRVTCRKGVELVYLDVTPGSVIEFRGERYAVTTNSP